MIDQIIILLFIIVTLVSTLWLYFLKARKEMEYKKDERWQLIQIKANSAANISNWILNVLLAIGTAVMLFSNIEITFTLQRVILMGVLFTGLRNSIELAAILYFDKQL